MPFNLKTPTAMLPDLQPHFAYTHINVCKKQTENGHI